MFIAAILAVFGALWPQLAFSHPADPAIEILHDPQNTPPSQLGGFLGVSAEEPDPNFMLNGWLSDPHDFGQYIRGGSPEFNPLSSFEELLRATEESDPDFMLNDWLSDFNDFRQYHRSGSPEFLNTDIGIDLARTNDHEMGMLGGNQDILAFPFFMNSTTHVLEGSGHILPQEYEHHIEVEDIPPAERDLKQPICCPINEPGQDATYVRGYRDDHDNQDSLNSPANKFSSNSTHLKRRKSSTASEAKIPTSMDVVGSKRVKPNVENTEPVKIPENAFKHFNNWMNVEGPRLPTEAETYALAIVTKLPESIVKSWFRFILSSVGTIPENSILTNLETQQANDHVSQDNDKKLSESSSTAESEDSCIAFDEIALAPLSHEIDPTGNDSRNQVGALLKDNFAKCTLSARRQTQPKGPFECTSGCGAKFMRKDDWRRHEEINQPQKVWQCVVCLQAHSPRSFKANRRDKMVGHINKEHPNASISALLQRSKIDMAMEFQPRICGFCFHHFHSWADRTNHIAGHFLGHEDIPWNLTRWQESIRNSGTVNPDSQGSQANRTTLAQLDLLDIILSEKPKHAVQRPPIAQLATGKPIIPNDIAIATSTSSPIPDPSHARLQPIIPPEILSEPYESNFQEGLRRIGRAIQEDIQRALNFGAPDDHIMLEEDLIENHFVLDELHAPLYFNDWRADFDLPRDHELELIGRSPGYGPSDDHLALSRYESNETGIVYDTLDRDNDIVLPRRAATSPPSVFDLDVSPDLEIRSLLNLSVNEHHQHIIESLRHHRKKGDLLKALCQSYARPVLQEQLAREVGGIYAGLIALEKEKGGFTSPEGYHSESGTEVDGLRNKLPLRLYEETWLDYVQDWRQQKFASDLDREPSQAVPTYEDAWIECLVDFGRYRRANKDGYQPDRETWVGVARFWYSKAVDKGQYISRLYHHLAILACTNRLFHQICHYYGTLNGTFYPRRSSDLILALFNLDLMS